MRATQQQIEALAGFRGALRRFLAFSEEATREAGITALQYQALLAIKARPGGAILVGELGDDLLIKPNRSVQLVDRLSSMNLVKREHSEADRRLVHVSLTASGEVLILELAALHLAQLGKRKKQLADIVRQIKDMRPK